jgi:hypothetical protein
MSIGRFIVPAIFLAVSQICTAQNGHTSLAIVITAPETCVKSGSPMEVRIVLTNTSDHDVSYRVVAMGQWSPTWAGMSVLDSAGKLLPDKRGPHDGSVFSGKATLGATKSIETRLDVAKDYDLSKPGKYTVEVWPLNGEQFKPNRVIVCISE